MGTLFFAVLLFSVGYVMVVLTLAYFEQRQLTRELEELQTEALRLKEVTAADLVFLQQIRDWIELHLEPYLVTAALDYKHLGGGGSLADNYCRSRAAAGRRLLGDSSRHQDAAGAQLEGLHDDVSY